jgi:hypothetical protein
MSSPLGGQPQPPMFQGNGDFTPPWAGWWSTIQNILFATSSSGPTASRPTTNLYVGRFWFDTTLGYPVWCKSLGSSPVWVNATGAPV